MSVKDVIVSKLSERFTPVFLDVINESDQHNVPAGSESHFRVTVVSAEFDGLMLVARHRLINKTLADELAGSIHALALHTYTSEEWDKRNGQVRSSPDCAGGTKN